MLFRIYTTGSNSMPWWCQGHCAVPEVLPSALCWQADLAPRVRLALTYKRAAQLKKAKGPQQSATQVNRAPAESVHSKESDAWFASVRFKGTVRPELNFNPFCTPRVSVCGCNICYPICRVGKRSARMWHIHLELIWNYLKSNRDYFLF